MNKETIMLALAESESMRAYAAGLILERMAGDCMPNAGSFESVPSPTETLTNELMPIIRRASSKIDAIKKVREYSQHHQWRFHDAFPQFVDKPKRGLNTIGLVAAKNLTEYLLDTRII